MGTRHRALQRPLDKIDALRHDEPALTDSDIAPLSAARARGLSRYASPRRLGSVPARDAGNGARGGQLGWMLGLAGLPLGVHCRFLDPSLRTDRGDGRSGRHGSARRSRRRRAAPPTGGRRHVRVGRRARRDRPPSRSDRAGAARRHPRSRSAQDRLRREGHLRRRSASRPRAYRAVDTPRRARPRGRRDRRCRRCSRPGAAATTARAKRSLRASGRRRIGVVTARRRAADPRGIRAVHPRAVDHRGARRATARPAAGRWSRTCTATASCASLARPRRGVDDALQARGRSVHRAPARRARLRRCRVRRAVRRRRQPARQRDRAAGAQQRPLDDRGRRDEPVREPPARRARAGRSARPPRAAPPRWSTASARCPTADAVLAVPGAHLYDYGKTAAARTQARPRHDRRARRRQLLEERLERVVASVDLTSSQRDASRDRADFAELGDLVGGEAPVDRAPRRCAGRATARTAAPRRRCARSAAPAPAAARRRVR